MAKYWADEGTGLPHEKTRIIKEENYFYYFLNRKGEWQKDSTLARYFFIDPGDTWLVEISEEEALRIAALRPTLKVE